MAPTIRKNIKSTSADNQGILSRVSESPFLKKGKETASDTADVLKKLLKSTGKAAWIAGTTALVLFLPLVIELDRDAQLDQLELQHSLLGTSPPAPASR